MNMIEILLKEMKYSNNISKLAGPIPIFQWEIKEDTYSPEQRAFQLRIKRGERIFWELGPVYSEKQSIVYRGMRLQEKKSYCWELIVWTATGKAAYAEGKFVT